MSAAGASGSNHRAPAAARRGWRRPGNGRNRRGQRPQHLRHRRRVAGEQEVAPRHHRALEQRLGVLASTPNQIGESPGEQNPVGEWPPRRRWVRQGERRETRVPSASRTSTTGLSGAGGGNAVFASRQSASATALGSPRLPSCNASPEPRSTSAASGAVIRIWVTAASASSASNPEAFPPTSVVIGGATLADQTTARPREPPVHLAARPQDAAALVVRAPGELANRPTLPVSSAGFIQVVPGRDQGPSPSSKSLSPRPRLASGGVGGRRGGGGGRNRHAPRAGRARGQPEPVLVLAVAEPGVAVSVAVAIGRKLRSAQSDTSARRRGGRSGSRSPALPPPAAAEPSRIAWKIAVHPPPPPRSMLA